MDFISILIRYCLRSQGQLDLGTLWNGFKFIEQDFDEDPSYLRSFKLILPHKEIFKDKSLFFSGILGVHNGLSLV